MQLAKYKSVKIDRYLLRICTRVWTFLPVMYDSMVFLCLQTPRVYLQESPAIADKPARRESLPKIVPIRRAYNVVADNSQYWPIFIRLAVVASEICGIPRNSP